MSSTLATGHRVRRQRRLSACGAALLLTTASWASGGILLDRIIVEFPSDQAPRQDIYVINEDDENAFVKVEVLAVNNPGEENEERVSLAGAENVPFLASPARLVIGPRGRKQVRLVNLPGPGATEQVYRINVTPVMPPLAKQTGATVQVVVAYQALAIAHPAEPREALQVTRSDNALHFHNTGNTYALLADGRQCDDQQSNCVDLPSRRLYAGNQWTIALPYATPVHYAVTTYKGVREQRF